MKVKLFSDLTKIKAAPSCGYVFPLLELLHDETSELHQYYEFTSIEDCDYIALPLTVDYVVQHDTAYFHSIFEKSVVFNKKVLVFAASDVGKTINHPNCITIRLGGFKSKFENTTYIMPPFINDPYVFLGKEVDYLSKEAVPAIGFVGHSNGSLIKLAKEFLIYARFSLQLILKKHYFDYQSFYPSSYYRFTYLNILARSKNVVTHFIYRKKYRAGVTSSETRLQTTKEFFDNIYSNPYTFCLRGTGNFSVRLYETLAMGRIPVVMNTDCQFPFDELIQWDNHCLIIEEKNINSIEKGLCQFHAKFTDLEFVAIQKANRKLWEDYFTKKTFFIKLSFDLLNKKYNS
jgi:hypothetical protein